MLKLIQVEFLKLRRRKFIWLMLLAALFMPLAAVFYFSSVKGTGVDPIMFYKWTAFSYTPWIILPVVLGMLCTMLMYNENQYDMLKQLWIVPVNKMAYFFSKFAVVLVYSICFMLVTATASILTGILFSEGKRYQARLTNRIENGKTKRENQVAIDYRTVLGGGKNVH